MNVLSCIVVVQLVFLLGENYEGFSLAFLLHSDFSFSRFLHKLNDTTCNHLHLASFTELKAFEIRPYYV